MLIYLTIYKLNDSQAAADVLEAYRAAWNKRLLNVSGAEIWIWDGYLDEMAGSARPQAKDSILYWDSQSDSGVLTDQVHESQPALTKTKTVLYSVHGETAYKEYFIMIDIKAEFEDIQNKTNSIFTEAAGQIFKIQQSPAVEETPTPELNESLDEGAIKEELRLLLESYLDGNITKGEYDSAFAELNTKLGELEQK
jgi:hypothetical protein